MSKIIPTKGKLVLFFAQLGAWYVWFTLNSTYYTLHYSKLPWRPALYNYLSIVVVTYCCYYLAASATRIIIKTDVALMPAVRAIRFCLFRWQWALVCTLAPLYVGVSWLFDVYVMQMPALIPDHFLKYWDGRFSRISTYMVFGVAAGVGMCLLRRYIAKSRRLQAQNNALSDLVADTKGRLQYLQKQINQIKEDA